MIKYLSPSSLMLFRKDPNEWYVKYHGAPRMAQTAPMAVGSAFDAFIKARIATDLGMDSASSDHSFDYMFESSVEEPRRDEALVAGEAVYKFYLEEAYPSLLSLLQRADAQPMMEDTLKRELRSPSGRPFICLGKPDLMCTVGGIPVILDWKVNGYYAKRRVSLAKGWHGHKDAVLGVWNKVPVNTNKDHSLKSDWELQCTTYAWLGVGEVMSNFVHMIDQIAGGGGGDLRWGRHSYACDATRCEAYAEEYAALWAMIQSGVYDGVDVAACEKRLAAWRGEMGGDAGLASQLGLPSQDASWLR